MTATRAPSRIVGRHAAMGAVAVAALLLPAGGRAAAPAGRYSYPATGTVLDLATHLTWQQGFMASLDRPGAVAYCKALALAGGNWRLPTAKEIFTIVDTAQPLSRTNPWVDPTAFPGSPYDYFWSLTPVRGDGTQGFAVLAWQMVPWPNTMKYDVRCVR